MPGFCFVRDGRLVTLTETVAMLKMSPVFSREYIEDVGPESQSA